MGATVAGREAHQLVLRGSARLGDVIQECLAHTDDVAYRCFSMDAARDRQTCR